jgi:hypothetical protein
MTPSSKTIAILIHARDDFEANDYFVRLFFPEWERQGLTVRVLRGIDEPGAADAVLSHVNLTVVPPEYRRYAETFRVAINVEADDISKHHVGTHLVRGPDEWDGPVIVKTDLNYGGRPERWQTRSTSRLGRLGLKVESQLPWTWTGALSSSDYKIYDRACEVPRIVWRNPRLAVQRYLPERQGSYYCLRQWIFFGDREMSTRAFASAPIVKASNTVERERGVPIPDELRALRRKLGFDYGKFDFGVVDGEVVLYDANRTPTRRREDKITPELEKLSTDLAQGIHGFLDRARDRARDG